MTDPGILDVLGTLVIIDEEELLGILDVLTGVLECVYFEGTFYVLACTAIPQLQRIMCNWVLMKQTQSSQDQY
jgi:hypothetical protein